MRVLLVVPPIYGDKAKQIASANQPCFPPLGVVSIATKVRNHFSDLEIKVIDGNISGETQILKKIKVFQPHIVGISDLTLTHMSALRIAKFAKEECGSIVVLGNDHAAMFARQIVMDCSFVDFIVTGDIGEIPFLLLLLFLTKKDNIDITKVPNLCFRIGNEIVLTEQRSYSIKEIYQDLKDVPDYSLLDSGLKPYIDNYKNRFSKFHDHDVIPLCVNNVRGCGKWKRRCAYCGILDLTPRFGDPQFFWNSLKKYHEQFGANFFFEVCDNFGFFDNYVEKLLDSLPTWFEISDLELMVYCHAQDLVENEKLVENLKKLKVKRVNIGLDSVSVEALCALRKRYTPGSKKNMNEKAVQKLTDANIQIHTSFVVGVIGERWEWLEKTVSFIKDLAELSNVVTIEFSRIVPLPFSPIWDIFTYQKNSVHYPEGIDKVLERYGLNVSLSKRLEFKEKYSNSHILNLEEMTEDWINNFTFLENDEVCKIIQEVNNYLKSKGKITGVNVV